MQNKTGKVYKFSQFFKSVVKEEGAPVTSLKQIRRELEKLKRQVQPINSELLIRLLEYIESREKLLKELLIHMNAVENHLVRVTELLQKLPQVNIGSMIEYLQVMVPKLDEIAYNTRKMVDYLEMAAEVPEEKKEEKEEEEEKKEKGEKRKENVVEELKKIEEQNKALIDALNKLSESLNKLGST